MTPIQILYKHLENEGLFSNWEAPDNSTQPAPEIQMRLLQESGVDNNKRILLIKSVGSSGTRYVSSDVFTFAIMGKVGEDAVNAETYASLIYSALLDFEFDECVIGIDPISPVNGAYLMASGRPVYDMEFTVKVDSDRFGAGKA